GYDTVEWAATQPWCDGQVGTWGHSYPSWCIWRLLGEVPPSLTAVFAGGMSSNLMDLNFGIFETGRRLEWTYQMAVDARSRVGDESGPQNWVDAANWWREVERGKWIWFTPFDDLPDDVFSTLTPQLKRYLREQNIDFWNFKDVWSKVTVPTCQVTGWWDRIIGTIDNFNGVVEQGAVGSRAQHRLVIGPWGHSPDSFERNQGPLDLGPDADWPYEEVIARWYDWQFKAEFNGLENEPPVRLFVMGENRWRWENEWPLARTRYVNYFLSSAGSAETAFGDGVLSTDKLSEGAPADTYDYDPNDPVMSMMGLDAQAAARDQAPLAHRQDILVFQTPVLEEAIEVTGPVVLKLFASSSAPDTDWTAKLIDVQPDGAAVNLTYGILRASYRDGYENPTPIEPGREYEYTIKLNPTGNVFMPGHRIRLDVSSSDFPNFDRNHNTGKDFWSDTGFRVAHQTVFHDSVRPSRLVLPIIPR
ncbi:MAG TPA: X-Pro dipeptidyl-peptidase, partial [Dehalococcoidia bacterium]|nr:X-Pro dipeptidyl-peptidase [Dehalococcoidia bacterium]